MTQTMRWFGPADPVSPAAIRQAGATEVVTALHEIPSGAVWTRTDLAYAMPDGAPALRFEGEAVAACDIHLLRRPEAARHAPSATILAGLPGAEERFTPDAFRDAIADGGMRGIAHAARGMA